MLLLPYASAVVAERNAVVCGRGLGLIRLYEYSGSRADEPLRGKGRSGRCIVETRA